jgi:hypothetical protein
MLVVRGAEQRRQLIPEIVFAGVFLVSHASSASGALMTLHKGPATQSKLTTVAIILSMLINAQTQVPRVICRI